MRYKVSLILAALLIAFSLTGCDKKIKKDEAEECIETFLESIETEDYETADSLLHPEKPGSVSELCMALEMGLGVDFQEGIEVTEFTELSSVAYDTELSGAVYLVDVEATVSDVDLLISFEIVRNDNGFGIYSYNFETE